MGFQFKHTLCSKILQQDLLNLAMWCTKWRIKLNPEKNKMIIFSRSILASKREPNQKLYDETLKVYQQVKFLGITFNSQLTFKSTSRTSWTAARTRYHHLMLLSQQKWEPSPSTLIQIYKQCARSIFEYIASPKFNGSEISLFGLPFVYQDTSVLSCFITPMAFHM